jgi:hypothetical protein
MGTTECHVMKDGELPLRLPTPRWPGCPCLDCSSLYLTRISIYSHITQQIDPAPLSTIYTIHHPPAHPLSPETQPTALATMSNPIPIPSPVPIRDSHANATGSGSHRASSVGRSLSTRRSSQSQGASGLGRRPSRVTHPPPVPTRALSHDEALDALRGFLKERSSYDVFPVSFRLIVLDTTLKVKKALDVMLLYSKSCWYGGVGG